MRPLEDDGNSFTLPKATQCDENLLVDCYYYHINIPRYRCAVGWRRKNNILDKRVFAAINRKN